MTKSKRRHNMRKPTYQLQNNKR